MRRSLIAFCRCRPRGEEPAADLRDVADHGCRRRRRTRSAWSWRSAIGSSTSSRRRAAALQHPLPDGQADVMPIARDGVRERRRRVPARGCARLLPEWAAGAEGATIRLPDRACSGVIRPARRAAPTRTPECAARRHSPGHRTVTRQSTLLLDLDGTLTDNLAGIIPLDRPRARRRWARPSPTLRRSRPASARRCALRSRGCSPPTDAARIEHAIALYRERYGELGWAENVVYDGVPSCSRRWTPRAPAVPVHVQAAALRRADRRAVRHRAPAGRGLRRRPRAARSTTRRDWSPTCSRARGSTAPTA